MLVKHSQPDAAVIAAAEVADKLVAQFQKRKGADRDRD
jgi:hypothetical protein